MVHNPRTWQRCVTAMSLFRERSTQRVLSVCVTFCAMAAAIVATQGVLAAPQRWWRDQAIQQNLRLTAEQVRQFDSLFERDVPAAHRAAAADRATGSRAAACHRIGSRRCGGDATE